MSPALREQPPAAVLACLIGRIEIPRLGVSAIVIEGTTTKILRRAVGHIADTLFRPLRDARRNDMITLTTVLGEYG